MTPDWCAPDNHGAASKRDGLAQPKHDSEAEAQTTQVLLDGMHYADSSHVIRQDEPHRVHSSFFIFCSSFLVF
jgi:hypothetical protein